MLAAGRCCRPCSNAIKQQTLALHKRRLARCGAASTMSSTAIAAPVVLLHNSEVVPCDATSGQWLTTAPRGGTLVAGIAPAHHYGHLRYTSSTRGCAFLDMFPRADCLMPLEQRSEPVAMFQLCCMLAVVHPSYRCLHYSTYCAGQPCVQAELPHTAAGHISEPDDGC